MDFNGANLETGVFTGASLTGTDMSGAALNRADFSGANLRDATLAGSDLSEASLVYANLTGADLSGALFNRTKLRETVFGNSNLAGARDLNRCQHLGPSVLDFQTLAKSGPLPLPFLRGCGMADTLIEYLPSLLGHGIEFYSCFISYSHEDKAFARRLHDTLQGRGIRCWLDEKQLRGGDDILDHVDRGIRLWDKVLLCCSQNSLNSGWVETELDKALEKEHALRKERGEKVLALIPLNLDGYLFSGWQSGRASIVKQRLAIDFTGWEESHTKCEEKIEEVIRALRADEHARETPPKSKL